MAVDAAPTMPLLNLYTQDDTLTKGTMIEVPIDLDQDDYNLNSIVHQHARDGNVERVEEILSRHPELINRSDQDGFTALHYAVKYGNSKVVELLLNRGANADVRSNENTTPLHMSAKYCRPYAHYSARSSGSGTSPLFIDLSAHSSRSTITNKTMAIVNMLVQHGANIDAVDFYGLTPLHYAAMKGNEPAAQALLMNSAGKQARAMLWSRNNEGKTPLRLAVEGNHSDTVRTILELRNTQSADIHEFLCVTLLKTFAEKTSYCYTMRPAKDTSLSQSASLKQVFQCMDYKKVFGLH
ncbi:hypothetical protein KIN20_008536 [Parelaphostrongylus tenuis]|uniref:Uncharacterized protein n=1 Tax=Parelaphostrongylus tenuis TaxID=148309 RepID=A0AAD5M4X0_PARTN|nr:hypothetical protein KIN20_008536 [Parelaphostrongylus tenuis]